MNKVRDYIHVHVASLWENIFYKIPNSNLKTNIHSSFCGIDSFNLDEKTIIEHNVL